MSTLSRHLTVFFGACLLYLSLVLPLTPAVSASQSRTLPTACRNVGEVTIYAAASLGPVLDALAELMAESGGPRLLVSLASSSVLARQIENGAPADLFLSADGRWIDYLQAAEMLRPEPPTVIARNRLVLVVRGNYNPVSELDKEDFAGLLQSPQIKRIATGDPNSVPLGAYAREWLQAIDLWNETKDKLLPAMDARAALHFFETGAADAAILYASDARGNTTIGSAFLIPENFHSPINYWALVPKNSDQADTHCLTEMFLGLKWAEILNQYGFHSLS